MYCLIRREFFCGRQRGVSFWHLDNHSSHNHNAETVKITHKNKEAVAATANNATLPYVVKSLALFSALQVGCYRVCKPQFGPPNWESVADNDDDGDNTHKNNKTKTERWQQQQLELQAGRGAERWERLSPAASFINANESWPIVSRHEMLVWPAELLLLLLP